LESAREQSSLSGLSDRGSEALVLLTFIPADRAARLRSPDGASGGGERIFWQSQPAQGSGIFGEADRLLTSRNRNWIPKLEGYMRADNLFCGGGPAHMAARKSSWRFCGTRKQN